MMMPKRQEFLSNIKLIHNIIIFDCGNDLLPTPQKVLLAMTDEVKKNIYGYNVPYAEKSDSLVTSPREESSGLQSALVPIKTLQAGLFQSQQIEVSGFSPYPFS